MGDGLVGALNALHHEYGSRLKGQYGFESEADRGYELVASILTVIGKVDENKARSIVRALRELGLLSSEACSPRIKLSPEELSRILSKSGLEQEAATAAVDALSQFHGSVPDRHPETFQLARDIGQYALDMLQRTDLLPEVEATTRLAVFRQWTQRGLLLPLPLEGNAVSDFCQMNECTVEDIVRAADELGINLLVLEDVLVIRYREVQASRTAERRQIPFA